MKILVAIKSVADPDFASSVKAIDNRVVTTGIEGKINRFDAGALEAALRLTEDGKTPKVRQGEVVVVTLGPKEAEGVLRTALAIGADRAIHVEAGDEALDGRQVSHALKRIIADERPDLVLLGKQTVDTEGNQVGQCLAALLDYPMVSSATQLRLTDGRFYVQREFDGELSTFQVTLPAVVTVELRITAPGGVLSGLSDPSFEYYDGVRFASLPAVMLAKRKPLAFSSLDAIAPGLTPTSLYYRFDSAPGRKSGVRLDTVAELVTKLNDLLQSL